VQRWVEKGFPDWG